MADDEPSSVEREATPTRLGRFGFSLRGLMVFTFGAAVGSTALRVENSRWFDGLLAAVLAWFVLGLLNQARDVWKAFHGRARLSPAERWGWRFACVWRVAMAVLLAGCYLVEHLVELKHLELPTGENWLDPQLRPILSVLCLLIVLKSAPRMMIKCRAPTIASRTINTFGWLALTIVGTICLISNTTVMFLVHVAIEGVRHATFRRNVVDGGNWVRDAQAAQFFWWSLAAITVTLCSLALIGQWNRTWTRGSRWRWVWAVLVSISLSAAACYVIWLHTTGLAEVSPAMNVARSIGPLHRWFTALLLVIVSATAVSYRIVSQSDEAVGDETIPWCRQERRYYHERPAVVTLLAVALSLDFAHAFIDIVFAPLSPFFSTLEIIGYSFTEPAMLMFACATLVALRSAFTGWLRPANVQPAGLPKLPLARFSAVWVATFLSIIVGIPTLAGFTFAIWLNPWWFRWSWL